MSINLGSVAGAQWDQVPTVAAVVLVTTALLALFGRRLNVLLAGDESATALGVDVNRLRAVLLVLSALLTGTVIAVAGRIGFVGLMIPHLVRLTTGADHRRLLPLTALLGRDGAEDHAAVSDAVDRCGVRPFADRDYASLSGGERQRVLLARALAQDPQLLVLDELTNHLDIRARFELLDLIRATGVTTLAVLHDLDLAARLCDHLVVLHEGTVVAAGPVLEVLTPGALAAVFGVRARTERHADGVVRITYEAQPLARCHQRNRSGAVADQRACRE
ncbi:iron chelate uptake ABC transporter family permease subunit [Streptomyces arenae]|uniref:iron chelate uptake ABC transporter family permease subunit n=1 Tax=Streptomyces arenae TaxID=29301 RepID=UPI00265A183F|nr:iron chelate uptake ABC transporter family permease subunit [Streptomyces arenae]MCG7206206.1 iron chelate uptake ABC transporter family permease subunit [Streptomyces arenae]